MFYAIPCTCASILLLIPLSLRICVTTTSIQHNCFDGFIIFIKFYMFWFIKAKFGDFRFSIQQCNWHLYVNTALIAKVEWILLNRKWDNEISYGNKITGPIGRSIVDFIVVCYLFFYKYLRQDANLDYEWIYDIFNMIIMLATSYVMLMYYSGFHLLNNYIFTSSELDGWVVCFIYN